jgi:hypothetical protein
MISKILSTQKFFINFLCYFTVGWLKKSVALGAGAG